MENFIINEYDFRSIATEEDLNVLSDENTKIINQCNLIAIHEASGYLSTKYNVEKLFQDINEYNSGTTYNQGDRIFVKETNLSGVTTGEYIFYTCINSGSTDLNDTNYFIEKDSRDQKLLEVIMSISLFYIHKRLSPNNIPLFRVNSYDGNGSTTIMSAIKWLTMIQKGELSPYNWTLLSEDVTEEDPEVPVEYDKLGNDPATGVMWGNDMCDEYMWYDQKYDKNIIRK